MVNARPAFNRHCANRLAVKIADGLNSGGSPLVIGRRIRYADGPGRGRPSEREPS